MPLIKVSMFIRTQEYDVNKQALAIEHITRAVEQEFQDTFGRLDSPIKVDIKIVSEHEHQEGIL
jgi:hypothetical protein